MNVLLLEAQGHNSDLIIMSYSSKVGQLNIMLGEVYSSFDILSDNSIKSFIGLQLIIMFEYYLQLEPGIMIP